MSKQTLEVGNLFLNRFNTSEGRAAHSNLQPYIVTYKYVRTA